jgi:hypothetical protein
MKTIRTAASGQFIRLLPPSVRSVILMIGSMLPPVSWTMQGLERHSPTAVLHGCAAELTKFFGLLHFASGDDHLLHHSFCKWWILRERRPTEPVAGVSLEILEERGVFLDREVVALDFLEVGVDVAPDVLPLL